MPGRETDSLSPNYKPQEEAMPVITIDSIPIVSRGTMIIKGVHHTTFKFRGRLYGLTRKQLEHADFKTDGKKPLVPVIPEAKTEHESAAGETEKIS